VSFCEDDLNAFYDKTAGRCHVWMGHSTIGMTMRYAHLAPGSGTVHIKALEIGPASSVYGNLTATRAS
jgi:hypothetical protein